MPNEYTITYKYTDTKSHGMGSGYSYIESSDSKWVKSGETTRRIGRVNRIECKRILSAGTYSTVTASCNLVFKSSSVTITSNSVTQSLSYNNYFNFEWTSSTLSSLTNAHFDNGWTLEINATSGKNIYWQAYSSYPLVLTVYFYDRNDMVGNSGAPTMSSTDISISGGSSGVYLRGQSNISISVVAHIDSSYSSQLVNTYTLSLTQNSRQIYNNSIAITGSGAATFNVGKINTIGTVNVNASMRDNVGRTAKASTTFSVTEYNQARIIRVAGTNGADRCKKVQDEYGTSSDYVIASDGTMVMINITAEVSNVSGQTNSGTLTVKWGTGSTPGVSQTNIKSLGTVTSGVQKIIMDDHTTITGTFSTSQDYWVRFELKDKFGALVTLDAYLNKVESIFNIEPNGVAVGQLSTGTSSNKKFECAYPAYFTSGATITNPTFKGTITGISTSTTYKSGEVDTGDKWIDGKAIYRFIWSGTSDLENEQGILCNLSSKASTIIFAGGMFQRPSDNAWLTIPNTYYADNAAWAVNLRIEKGQEVYIGFGSKATGTKNVIFCCLYTK